LKSTGRSSPTKKASDGFSDFMLKFTVFKKAPIDIDYGRFSANFSGTSIIWTNKKAARELHNFTD
jgi:hypothetical protein